MKKVAVGGGLAGVAIALAAGVFLAFGSGGSGKAQPARAQGEDPVGKQLATARAATARYQRVEEALADGYVADGFCIASPAGAMGDHYVRVDLLGDGILDPEKPEVLLYMAGENGKPKLVAVEYFKPDADQKLSTSDDKPSLFGQPFDGPMPGHSQTMPIHYDLHVWLWANDPAGMFAQFNPSLTCPPAP